MDLDTLRDAILEHPWRSVALAFVGGAALAYADEPRRSVARSFAFAILRELATARAKSWIDARERPYAAAQEQRGPAC